MSLNQGQSIGPYLVEQEIGRGGMGIVFLARDTRLDRQVAIKSLPEHLAVDPERLARFEREAKVLATLNHPNVAGIYGVEEVNGARYLILEYVEGETVAERLDRGALPVDEAIELAVQIAKGVEAAHEAGVVHRDLKPANIKISLAGDVKVLDFGLARTDEGGSASSSVSQLPTLTSPAMASPTTPGVILGTAAYMSPEQARGRSVDKRTDIWSFGVLLHEMLTGRLLFGGETVSDSIAAILERRPELDQLPSKTPTRVRDLLARCLEKDTNKRLRDIGDARLELERSIADEEWMTASLASIKKTPSNMTGRAIVMTLFGAAMGSTLALIIAGAVIGVPTVDSGEIDALRFEIPVIVEDTELAVDDMAISPDGSTIVIAPIGGSPLLVRELDSFEFIVLDGTENAQWPMFSPDGRSIAFYQDSTLFRIDREGGLPVAISDTTGLTQTGAWLDTGMIVDDVEGRDTIVGIDVRSGVHTEIASIPVDSELLGFEGQVSVPGRDYFLTGAYTGNSVDAYSIARVDLEDGSVKTILPDAANPLVTDSATLVFLRDSSLFVVAFDHQLGEVKGDPRRVLEGVTASEWGGEANVSLSRSGDLLYLPGWRLSDGRRLVSISDEGSTQPLTETDFLGEEIAVSPDGSKIVYNTLRRQLESWILDAERGISRRIVGEGEAHDFVWNQAGRLLTYRQIFPDRGYNLNDIVIRDEASGGNTRVVATVTAPYMHIEDWLPDGSGILITQIQPASDDAEILYVHRVVEIDGREASSTLFDQDEYSVYSMKFSPDGKWLAYLSDQSGQTELYIRAYPEAGRAWQVSFAPSATPVNWAPDSSAIYWLERDRMLRATIDVADDGNVSIGLGQVAMHSPWPNAWSRWASWEMNPVGGFIAMEPASWEQTPLPPRLILGWEQEVSDIHQE
ncbi:MAG: serine/threonine-protein kinase [Planctomycetota bacterium]|jgi:serine/threonine protein kinase